MRDTCRLTIAILCAILSSAVRADTPVIFDAYSSLSELTFFGANLAPADPATVVIGSSAPLSIILRTSTQIAVGAPAGRAAGRCPVTVVIGSATTNSTVWVEAPRELAQTAAPYDPVDSVMGEADCSPDDPVQRGIPCAGDRCSHRSWGERVGRDERYVICGLSAF